MSRRTTYQWLAEGRLKAVKLGTKTLMDLEHNLAVLQSLPAAKFTRPGPRPKAAHSAAASSNTRPAMFAQEPE
jgi:hypothetical protein